MSTTMMAVPSVEVSAVTTFADRMVRQTEVPDIDAWAAHLQTCGQCRHARRRDRRGLCADGRANLARRDQAFRDLVTGRL